MHWLSRHLRHRCTRERNFQTIALLVNGEARFVSLAALQLNGFPADPAEISVIQLRCPHRSTPLNTRNDRIGKLVSSQPQSAVKRKACQTPGVCRSYTDGLSPKKMRQNAPVRVPLTDWTSHVFYKSRERSRKFMGRTYDLRTKKVHSIDLL